MTKSPVPFYRPELILRHIAVADAVFSNAGITTGWSPQQAARLRSAVKLCGGLRQPKTVAERISLNRYANDRDLASGLIRDVNSVGDGLRKLVDYRLYEINHVVRDECERDKTLIHDPDGQANVTRLMASRWGVIGGALPMETESLLRLWDGMPYVDSGATGLQTPFVFMDVARQALVNSAALCKLSLDLLNGEIDGDDRHWEAVTKWCALVQAHAGGRSMPTLRLNHLDKWTSERDVRWSFRDRFVLAEARGIDIVPAQDAAA